MISFQYSVSVKTHGLRPVGLDQMRNVNNLKWSNVNTTSKTGR